MNALICKSVFVIIVRSCNSNFRPHHNDDARHRSHLCFSPSGLLMFIDLILCFLFQSPMKKFLLLFKSPDT